MPGDSFPDNLRLLCSYGRSTSDICRRAGFNRHQFNKYLTGQTQPSLSTLRRICDFFGVDEYEILLDTNAFRELIRRRPPTIRSKTDPIAFYLHRMVREPPEGASVLERHAGYYHTYFRPAARWPFVVCSLTRIHLVGETWLSKSLTWNRGADFAFPAALKFSGIALEGHNRLLICEREQGAGRTMWTTMLIASDYANPTYLTGLTLGMTQEGDHNIGSARTVWHYLGRKPNLRSAIGHLGIKSLDASDLSEFVRNGTDNSLENNAFG